MFGTLQGRLPAELALHNITTMEAANAYLSEMYLPRHHHEFTVAPEDAATAFIPFVGRALVDVLSQQEERVFGHDNTVRDQGSILQIPASQHRHHYVKATVTVCNYPDDTLAIFHEHQCLAWLAADGKPVSFDQGMPRMSLKTKENRALDAGESARRQAFLCEHPFHRASPYIQCPHYYKTTNSDFMLRLK